MPDVSSHVSAVDCLADLSRLRHLPSLYDPNIAQLTVLHGIAAMVQTYRHLQLLPAASFGGAVPGARESVLPDESHYRFLLRVFESLHQMFRLSETSADMPLTILLVFELLPLHFHCSID